MILNFCFFLGQNKEMSQNIFYPHPSLYKSKDPKTSFGCFLSGQQQQLTPRPVLKHPATAFGQFPKENNWVDQLHGIESKMTGQCVPPSIAYRCAINKMCRHYSLLPGNIAPNGQTYGPTLNYPQINQCSKNIAYRQLLDSRKGTYDCSNC